MRLFRLVPNGPAGLLGVLVFLFFTGSTAHAITRHAASNGIDGPSCGTAAAPCRSISQALLLAGTGGHVIVGPGRYGDLDADGNLGGVGEEPLNGGCNCMIQITEAVTLESKDGAGATVLDAPPNVTVVRIQSDDVVFGKKNRGFTVTGGFQGMQVDLGFAGTTVRGNLFAGNGSTGLSLNGNDHTIVGNSAVGNTGTGFIFGGVTSTGLKVSNNFASGNGQLGFSVRGLGFTVRNNVAGNNAGTGFSVSLRRIRLQPGGERQRLGPATATRASSSPARRASGARPPEVVLGDDGHRHGGIFMGGNGVRVEDSNTAVPGRGIAPRDRRDRDPRSRMPPAVASRPVRRRRRRSPRRRRLRGALRRVLPVA